MAYYNGYNGYTPNVPYYPNNMNNMNNMYMQQQQLQQQQQMQPQQQMTNNNNIGTPNVDGLRGRKVATIEEVKALPIDFDGSIYFFPATDGKRIYTKQLNLDGTVAIKEYRLTEMPAENEQGSGIQTEEENKLIQSLMARVKTLEETQQELLKSLGGK